MSSLSSALQHALAASSEGRLLASHLSALILSYPPPFIFVHDHENPRITAHIVHSALESLPDLLGDDDSFKYACLDAVACFSPRILFDTALNALAGWTPDWDDSVHNWQPSTALESTRFNENFDAFVHGIQAVTAGFSRLSMAGKGKARLEDLSPSKMVLVIERADRLKDHLCDLIVPLTRLAELSQVAITTIFISDVHWQDIRPPLGASPEPYYIDVPVLSKQATLDLLSSSFHPLSSDTCTSQMTDPHAYHPALEPLYSHFIAALYGTCSPFTHDPLELAYVAASRWPGFVQPVLDAQRHHATIIANDEQRDDDQVVRLSPSEDTRLRLIRLFTPSLTAALEVLHPRLSNATQWACIHAPPQHLLEVSPGLAPDSLVAQAATNALNLNVINNVSEAKIDGLPRMAKFVLVAAFIASTNPARSDVRMFGRGLDERARRRKRKMGTPRKPKPGLTGTAVKIPQRLLGPTAFPLDRLVAILGVLLEENDASVRPVALQYTLPGEYTEMEISRMAVYASIMELASTRLLVRASPSDKLDATPTFKCGIGYELAVKLARGVGIVLNDLLYEVL